MANSIEITKTIYDGQKFTDLGSFNSLESAHYEHQKFSHQKTFEDIELLDKSIPYMHLLEFRDGQHYNDLYFTSK